jgi:non-ribosomal peptide synthetase component E (peptide arylation enzyme)
MTIGVTNPIPGVIYPPTDRLRTYVEAGELPDTTLVEALQKSFLQHADRVALSFSTGTMSYAELDQVTDRFAAALIGLGLEPLDRVLFQSGNSSELICAFVGCLKAGLIPVCTLPAHREREIGYLGRHVDARALIVHDDDPKFDLVAFAIKMQREIPTAAHVLTLRGAAREGVRRFEDMVESVSPENARKAVDVVPRDPYQVGVFQLSGGTTGVPKVIPRMQNDYLLNATLTIRQLGYRSADVMFMPMPMIHNACMICFWLPTLLAGAEFVIPADMNPESWATAFRDRRPTFVGLIRALFPRFDATAELVPEAIGDIRSFWCPDGARLLRANYGVPAYGMFGMSEGLNMYTADSDPDEAKDWTVGRPLSRFDDVRLVEPGTDIEVGFEEIGELTCRGPYTLSGYYNAPERNLEAFTTDGFYKTGDLIVKRKLGDEVYYAFAGRTKDVVDRGTEKINCEEVENAVSTHPAISGCAVVGMPDPVLGERACAYVVIRSGQAAPDVAGLGRHLESFGMAKFKWPERIEAIEALPLTKVGKLDKAALRADIIQKLAQKPVKDGV